MLTVTLPLPTDPDVDTVIVHGAGVRFVRSATFWRMEYRLICPYTDHEFYSDNPRRIYCRDSHKVMFFKKTRSN